MRAMTQAELEQGVGEVLIEQMSLQGRIAELGVEISADYAGRDLLLVGVLKGAVFFMADLMRELTVPCEIDFMAISSYGAATDSSGVVRILKDLDINVAGRDVLVVEDIIDSGLTLSYLIRNLRSRKPSSLEVVTLLTKPERREIDVPVRYVGFEIPNRFVIGYGLDFAERYRNLPYVAVLHPGPRSERDLGKSLRSAEHVRAVLRARTTHGRSGIYSRRRPRGMKRADAQGGGSRGNHGFPRVRSRAERHVVCNRPVTGEQGRALGCRRTTVLPSSD